MRIPIRWKLILSIGLPMLVVYGVVLWTEYSAARDRALADRQAGMVEVVLRHAAIFDAQFASAAQVGWFIANVLEVEPAPSTERLYALLRNVVTDTPVIYGAGVALIPANSTSESSRPTAPYACRGDNDTVATFDIAKSYDYTQARWDWYNLPLKDDQPHWTEPYFDEGAGNIAMCTFAIAVRHEGRPTAVVKVDIRLDTLRRQVRGSSQLSVTVADAAIQSNLSHGGGAFAIIDRQGTFISYPDASYIMRRTIFSVADELHRPDLAKLAHTMLDGSVGFARVNDWADGGPAWFFYAPIQSTQWSFIAMAPERRFMEPAYAQLQLSGAILVSGLIVIVGILLLSAFRITSPLEKLDRAVEKLAAGNLDVRVEGIRHRDEIGDLARAFNQMVSELRDSVQRWTDEHAARQAVEHDLRTARHIQKSLLPKPMTDAANRFQLAALNVPARHIGGDFYDYFFVSDTQLMLVLGDASGKGVPAALLMAVTRTLLRELARPGRTPAQILTQANDQLLGSNAASMFVTVYMALYDVTNGHLTYASAAHPLAQCIRDDGNVHPCGEATGTVLGILPGQTFEDRQFTLNPGERLVIFTDGFPEARTPDGEFYGDERFVDLLRRHGVTPLNSFCHEVVNEVAEFQRHELRDDMTIMIFQRTGSPVAKEPAVAGLIKKDAPKLGALS